MYTNGLRKIRDTIDCSQREFARALGVDHVNLNNWEWAKSYPGPRYRRYLQGILNIPPAELAALLTTQSDDYEPGKRLLQRCARLVEQNSCTP